MRSALLFILLLGACARTHPASQVSEAGLRDGQADLPDFSAHDARADARGDGLTLPTDGLMRVDVPDDACPIMIFSQDGFFSVPEGCSAVTIEAWGGGGGGGGGDGIDNGGEGGGGGYAKLTTAVTPGQVLIVRVGRGGVAGGDDNDPCGALGGGGAHAGGDGGPNHKDGAVGAGSGVGGTGGASDGEGRGGKGGFGGGGGGGGDIPGGGGGGASAVSRGAVDLVVAGGGGGGGGAEFDRGSGGGPGCAQAGQGNANRKGGGGGGGGACLGASLIDGLSRKPGNAPLGAPGTGGKDTGNCSSKRGLDGKVVLSFAVGGA